MGIKLLILTLLFLLFGASSAFASNIKINEFYAAGTTSSNPDWVEVYSDGVDISLYQLMDTVNNKKDLAGATCNGNFCTIDWYNYLNNSGDTIKLVLKIAIDSPIDQVTYPGDISIPSSGQSAARNPDVMGSWLISSSPTKGVLNNPSTPSPTATSTSSPTPTPSPTPNSTPAPSSSSSISSFTISNIPSQINSDQSFTVSVNLSLPNNPGTTYYLSGAFKIVDGTRYFGLTKINSDWISYSSTNFSNQYKITTDSSGVWNGNLEVKPDATDSDYKGTGDYTFKVARYTQAGSQTWSNDGTIKIIGAAQRSNSSETLSNDSPSPNSTTSPSIKSIITTSQNKSSGKTEYKIASIAGVTTSATPSATPSAEIKSQKQTNFPLIIGLVLITSGIGLSAYIYLRNHETIFNKFRNRN